MTAAKAALITNLVHKNQISWQCWEHHKYSSRVVAEINADPPEWAHMWGKAGQGPAISLEIFRKW